MAPDFFVYYLCSGNLCLHFEWRWVCTGLRRQIHIIQILINYVHPDGGSAIFPDAGIMNYRANSCLKQRNAGGTG
ncbi:hypothetical protein [Morganella psychrotolerans]|uniref:hypothetical protein n=1 Tax=Morganella psychrotolerans TaxID=368603 RepID=UPI0039AEF4D5